MKPDVGKTIKISHDAHHQAKIAAALENMPLQTWISKALMQAAQAVQTAKNRSATELPK
jgi:predicted HicB family RNase H-like nuclease